MSEEEADKLISFLDGLSDKELVTFSYQKCAPDPEDGILSAIKSSGELSEDVIKQAFNHKKAFRFAMAILERDDAKEWYFAVFDKLGHNNEAQMALALKSDLPDFILWKLALHGYGMVRCKVAKVPNLPLGLIDVLSKDRDESVRIAIARRKDVSDKILEVLYNDPSWKVQSIVERKRGFETVHLRVRKSVGLTPQDIRNLGILGVD